MDKSDARHLAPPPAAATDPGQATRTLVEAMRSPACYPHPVQAIEVLETHISYVVLAGDFAYKVKKPVRFPFLDFSTLAARRACCEEEVRLNQRTAPEIYLDVVAITGVPEAPFVDGPGPAIEFAVRMHRFAGGELLDRLARHGELGAGDIDLLAASVARFHEAAPRVAANSPCGSPGLVLEQAVDNLLAIGNTEAAPAVGPALDRLRDWTREEHGRCLEAFVARRLEGFVREVHGDLHLGNVVRLGGVPKPFDAIEFDPRLREIDVMSDVAFLAMDLGAHGLSRLAARFLDRYLERTGDFGGLAVLRFYLVYRALVRAKVATLREHQEPGTPAAAEAHRSLLAHLRQAQVLARRAPPALVLMHGVSGSGKTTVSDTLLEALGAVRVRSDVERRRLHGASARGSTGSGIAEGMYAPAATEATYDRLLEIAWSALPEGWPVIVDATFLERGRRETFRKLAEGAGARFAIVTCAAGEAALEARIRGRGASGRDASEADLAVLARQRALDEPLGAAEQPFEVRVDTTRPGAAEAAADALLRRL